MKEQRFESAEQIQNIAEKFQIRGRVTSVERMDAGYINRTYKITSVSDDHAVHCYTLQRINTNVFRDVDALMDNFLFVTSHLHETYLLPGRREKGSVQMVKPLAGSGKPYLQDESGCWRMMTHFQHVYSLDLPDCPKTFYEAGKAFGAFVREMSDVPVERIRITIPNFHNTYSRYLDLEKAVAADPCGRAAEVQPEIRYVRERKSQYDLISKALESGEIPTRICHNDCNLNNLLFDNTTKLPAAIIDLDTVMPSSPLYDFGDSMRVGTNSAKDDEKDLSKVRCDLNLYEQYARGYLEACGKMLTRRELELLPYASIIITMEDGIRFLTDHLNGDTYYTISYSGQNLDRSRTQLRLAEDMEKKLPQIREILNQIYEGLQLDAEASAE